MADPTYPIALAALRAECGEPTYTQSHSAHQFASWGAGALDGRADVLTLSQEPDGEVWLTGCAAIGSRAESAAWTLAGTPTPDAPLTPLADAVRDAGAWLRGRG